MNVVIDRIKIQQNIVQDINLILNRYSLPSILLEDLVINDLTVSDLVNSDAPLSSKIINKIWPSVSKATVFHYTSKANAESILNSGTMRLYSILKRYAEDEISSFCIDHSLAGYLEKDANGEEKYKTLIMPNTFYTSFAPINGSKRQQEYLWQQFAVDVHSREGQVYKSSRLLRSCRVRSPHTLPKSKKRLAEM